MLHQQTRRSRASKIALRNRGGAIETQQRTVRRFRQSRQIRIEMGYRKRSVLQQAPL